MSSYLGNTLVRADVKTVFDYICRPENITDYVPCFQSVDVGEDSALHVKGECPHGKFRGVGTLHVDTEESRLRWDSRATLTYRGAIRVLTHGETDSEVTLHLEFEPGLDREANKEFEHLFKEHPGSIQDQIGETLAIIKRNCEALVAAKASLI